MDLKVNDKVELKKTHPCGSKEWLVLRIGMDIKLRCLGCGHEIMAPGGRWRRVSAELLRRRKTHETQVDKICSYGHCAAAGSGDAADAGGSVYRALNPVAAAVDLWYYYKYTERKRTERRAICI